MPGSCITRILPVKILSKILIFSLFPLSLFPAGARAQNLRNIYLVRHADKVSDETDAPLSDRGRQRAECLAKMLADAHIQKIYTSDLQRTQQTAAPLAAQQHLKPVAISLSKPDDLIEALRTEKAANILVVWHDATLPKILRALGAPEIAPIAHTEYDRFFILTVAAGKRHFQTGFTVLRYCNCAP
jgi:phosphohistidine phosphatase SixA